MYTNLLSLLSILPPATAICPGYNYAFFNTGDGWFYTSDVSCRVAVSGRCDNICDCRAWGCGPAGSVNLVKVNGLWYKCRDDAGKGNCGPENDFAPPPQLANRAPESCCRNDGARNFAEGLIGKREAEAIAETNRLLDRHVEEFEAVVGGEGERDVDVRALRRRQEAEVEVAMKEVEAGGLDE